MPQQDAIVIKGAREHNLKNIDITIPRNQLVVITGLSATLAKYTVGQPNDSPNEKQGKM